MPRWVKTTLVAVAVVSVTLAGTACGTGKPSKDQVKAGAEKIIQAVGRVTDADQIAQLADCLTEGIYEVVSVEGLSHIAKGDQRTIMENLSEADLTQINAVGESCEDQLG